MACCNGDDEIVGLVIAQGEPVPIDSVEGDDRRQGEPLGAIDKGVVAGK